MLFQSTNRPLGALLAGLLLGNALPAHAQSPSVFLAGIVSTGDANELTPALSSDGTVMFFARWKGVWGGQAATVSTIYRAERGPAGWSEPEPASFSGQYDDSDPFVAPDGYLYFTSNRPAPGKNDESADIWRVSLAGGVPERLPPPISSAEAEYSPVVARSGNLYFASSRPGGAGQGDIYGARWNGTGWDEPARLGPAINSPTGEWNVWVDPSETMMILESSSRPTNVSASGDLYLSVRSESGWTPALALAGVNGEGSDLMGRLDESGETLLYTRAALGGRASVHETPWTPLRDRTLAPLERALVVANRSSHDLSFVSVRDGKVVATLPVSLGPHLLSNVEKGRAVSTGYGQFPRPHTEAVQQRPPFVVEPDPTLNLIDVSRREVLRRISLRDCIHPHASWLVGKTAWVTCEDEREILAVDVETGNVVKRFDTKQGGSHVLGWHAATSTLVVSNTESGSVTLLDVESGRTDVVPLAPGSEGSVILEERAEAWVGNAGDGSISVVDLRFRREVDRLEGVCRMPIALARRESRVWVACFAARELVSLDLETREAAKRIALSEQPLNLLLHDELPLAYVSLPRLNAVAEIDLLQGEETRRIPVGIEPDGLRWAEAASPDPGRPVLP